MVATLVINVFVVRYESRAGRRLRSEVLGADAKHTRSDVWTTIAVLAALTGVALGLPGSGSDRGPCRLGLHRLRVLADCPRSLRRPRR